MAITDIPDEISKHVILSYQKRGTFIEIKARKTGQFIWVDPWWTDKYRIMKEDGEISALKAKLREHAPNRRELRAILVSHAHGDHFADVPEYFRQCLGWANPPLVYGDANVQSMVCHYVGIQGEWRNIFGHYRNAKHFFPRELSRLGQSSDIRRKLGVVRNLVPVTTYFKMPMLFDDKRDPDYFRLWVKRAPFVHNTVPDGFIGGPNPNLSGDPGERERLCKTSENASCPMSRLFGFHFVIKTNDRVERSFAIIPGKDFDIRDKKRKRNMRALFRRSSFVYHIPEASNLFSDWNVNRREVHVADPCSDA